MQIKIDNLCVCLTESEAWNIGWSLKCWLESKLLEEKISEARFRGNYLVTLDLVTLLYTTLNRLDIIEDLNKKIRTYGEALEKQE